MSTKTVVEDSRVRIRWTLSACWVVLAVGWASVAGAAEDLISAATRGDAAAVQALIASGADVNAKTKVGVTALMQAAESGHLDVVQALISKGADVNAKTEGGVTALMQASREGYLDIVLTLLANGAAINLRTTIGGYTAVYFAFIHDHEDIYQTLTSKGAREFPIVAVNGKSEILCTAIPLEAASCPILNGNKIVGIEACNPITYGKSLRTCERLKTSSDKSQYWLGDATESAKKMGGDVRTPLKLAK